MEKLMEWRNYHIYYTNIDRLLLDCIGPFLRSLDGLLDLYFWERHFAGGPHVRVRLHGALADLEIIAGEFSSLVENYLALFPADAISNYSSDDARQMMEMEGETYEPGDLVYQVNVIRECPYHRLKSGFVGEAGLRLLHEFLHDSNALTETILKHPAAKRDHLLRFYFLNALFPHGDLVRGSVSFKSHWSGFAASLSNRAVIDRIKKSFDDQSDAIVTAMLEVQEAYISGNLSGHPILRKWLVLLQRYDTRARAVLRTGEQIGSTLTPEQVRAYREYLEQHALEQNDFMRVLLEDDRFVAAFRDRGALAQPRILTNLLYKIIPALGLTALDKMALCYFAYNAVETHFQCDLTDVLRHNIATTLNI